MLFKTRLRGIAAHPPPVPNIQIGNAVLSTWIPDPFADAMTMIQRLMLCLRQLTPNGKIWKISRMGPLKIPVHRVG
jgi:hypothetical protein